jgi:hypothetical protein
MKKPAKKLPRLTGAHLTAKSVRPEGARMRIRSGINAGLVYQKIEGNW